jgi:predicted MFS family arabinose efflux permease
MNSRTAVSTSRFLRGEALGRSASETSLRGLDALNFLMADVRDGVGPLLSVFLKGAQHWGSADIGLAMAAGSIAAALSQIPAGLLVDSLRCKRLLVAVSGLLIAVGSLSIALRPTLLVVVAAQIGLGAASAVIPPVLAAISLGLVGRRMLPARISRNEGFNHAGNFTAAALAGMLGQYAGYRWMFWLVCLFAAASAAAVARIRPGEINHVLARGGDTHGAASPMSLRDLLRRRDLVVFLISVILFHFGNAAQLVMAGVAIAVGRPCAPGSAESRSSLWRSPCCRFAVCSSR